MQILTLVQPQECITQLKLKSADNAVVKYHGPRSPPPQRHNDVNLTPLAYNIPHSCMSTHTIA